MVKGLIRQRDEIDKMQCDLISGRGIKYAFLLLPFDCSSSCSLLFYYFYCMSPTEKHMNVNKPLYMTSIDLEEAFDPVSRDVI